MTEAAPLLFWPRALTALFPHADGVALLCSVGLRLVVCGCGYATGTTITGKANSRSGTMCGDGPRRPSSRRLFTHHKLVQM